MHKSGECTLCLCAVFFFFTGKEVFSSPSKGIMFDMLQSPFCLCVCKIQTDYRDKQSVCFQKIDFPFSDIMRDLSPMSSLSSGPVLRHLTESSITTTEIIL